MKYQLTFLLIGLCAAVLMYIRFSPIEADRWHVDPLKAEPTSRPNWVLWGDHEKATAQPIILKSLSDFETLEAQLLSLPRVQKLASTQEGTLRSYIFRTKLMGYPDMLSVRLEQRGADLAVHLYSRSRFGRSDLGQNLKRLQMIEALSGEL